MNKLLASVAVAAILASSTAFAQAPMDPAPATDSTTKSEAPAKPMKKHKGKHHTGKKAHHKKKKAAASSDATAPASAQ